MRLIIGPSGITTKVSDTVASGMVLAGHARYADEPDENPDQPAVDDPAGTEDDVLNSEPTDEQDDGDTEDENEDEEAVEEGVFDPSGSTVSEVLAYLGEASEEEQARVLGLEGDNKARSSILGWK